MLRADAGPDAEVLCGGGAIALEEGRAGREGLIGRLSGERAWVLFLLSGNAKGLKFWLSLGGAVAR